MLVLQKLCLLSLLLVPTLQAAQDPKQQLNDQLFEAVRKGDAAAVTALLDKGADVNAKFRYGQTVLFKAAERGNAEVVKVLLARGVDVTVKDTFYGATARSWAMNGGHYEVVRLIFEKDPSGADEVLMTGVRESNEGLVKMALDSGKVKPQTLTAALIISTGNEKNAGIAELLKKAGAAPPLEIDAATLQSYAGKYKGEPSPEFTIAVKDGKLSLLATGQPNPVAMMPVDKTNFRPVEFEGFTITFNVEGGNVTSLAFKQGPNTTQMKRVVEPKP
ncbi:MAG TPA: ankyrin repeat domain-containing protein [Pyrinomonadaceae bacterium]|nr:ankyrin repeat domain-containing protein [Pyrinomonadaceae bacterium]